MLERRAGVVRRIDVDALHAPGVVGQQRLQGFKVVTLNEHVGAVRIAGTEFRRRFQQPIGRDLGPLDVLVAGEPLEPRHKSGIPLCRFFVSPLLVFGKLEQCHAGTPSYSGDERTRMFR